MVKLATDKELYRGVREKIEKSKGEVFDTKRWVEELEGKILDIK